MKLASKSLMMHRVAEIVLVRFDISERHSQCLDDAFEPWEPTLSVGTDSSAGS